MAEVQASCVHRGQTKPPFFSPSKATLSETQLHQLKEMKNQRTQLEAGPAVADGVDSTVLAAPEEVSQAKNLLQEQRNVSQGNIRYFDA